MHRDIKNGLDESEDLLAKLCRNRKALEELRLRCDVAEI